MDGDMTIPNTPPPRIVMFEPFSDCEPMEVRPAGLREQAAWLRWKAANELEKAFELEAMAAEAELTGTPWRRQPKT